MNEILIATAGLLLTSLIYAAGKNPKMLSSRLSKRKGISSTTNIEISLIEPPKKTLDQNKFLIDQEKGKWKKPISSQERIALKKLLLKEISSNPENRLNAIEIASLWSDPWVIALLRRGLKDSDSRVVCAAAAGITKYKGKTQLSKSQSAARPPRNVAPMR